MLKQTLLLQLEESEVSELLEIIREGSKALKELNQQKQKTHFAKVSINERINIEDLLLRYPFLKRETVYQFSAARIMPCSRWGRRLYFNQESFDWIENRFKKKVKVDVSAEVDQYLKRQSA